MKLSAAPKIPPRAPATLPSILLLRDDPKIIRSAAATVCKRNLMVQFVFTWIVLSPCPQLELCNFLASDTGRDVLRAGGLSEPRDESRKECGYESLRFCPSKSFDAQDENDYGNSERAQDAAEIVGKSLATAPLAEQEEKDHDPANDFNGICWHRPCALFGQFDSVRLSNRTRDPADPRKFALGAKRDAHNQDRQNQANNFDDKTQLKQPESHAVLLVTKVPEICADATPAVT
jgi:hypothetical protein